MRVNKNIYVTFLGFLAFFYGFDPNDRTQILEKVEKLLVCRMFKPKTTLQHQAKPHCCSIV